MSQWRGSQLVAGKEPRALPKHRSVRQKGMGASCAYSLRCVDRAALSNQTRSTAPVEAAGPTSRHSHASTIAVSVDISFATSASSSPRFRSKETRAHPRCLPLETDAQDDRVVLAAATIVLRVPGQHWVPGFQICPAESEIKRCQKVRWMVWRGRKLIFFASQSE